MPAVALLPRALQGPMGQALVELAAPAGPSETSALTTVIDNEMLANLSPHVFTHRLDAPFVEMLTQLGAAIPPGHLERVAQDRVARLRVTAALSRVGTLFDTAGIPWLAFKGPLIGARMAHPHHRGFNDLDLLVAGGSFGKALDVLIEAGADEINHNWDAYVAHEIGEVPMSFGGIPIDLHWSIVGLGSWRRTMRLDEAAMIARRKQICLGDVTSNGFDDADALLHLCVHAALAGAIRLDQLRDIAVAATNIDWNDFTRRATDAYVAPLVGHALDRSAIIVGAEVPQAVRADLAGRELNLRRRIDATGDPTRAVLRGSPIVASRNNLLARARALKILTAARLSSRLGRHRGWDFADPDGHLYQDTPSGGAKARQTFIDLAG